MNHLNKAVAWCYQTALHDRVMKKNVSGHLSPVSPTETILQPEHSYKGMTPREDVNTCFNSVVCTHLPKT